MIGFLANTLGKWQLGRKAEGLEVKSEALNLSEMNSAVLIFDIEEEPDYQDVVGFVKRLKSEGLKKIWIIGYFEGKEIPTFIDQNVVQVITKKDVNLIGFPSDVICNGILKDRFDLLVDCTDKDKITTEYFLTLIYAKTKVGRDNTSKQNVFDLLINQEGSNKKEYFKSVIHFLKMINKL